MPYLAPPSRQPPPCVDHVVRGGSLFCVFGLIGVDAPPLAGVFKVADNVATWHRARYAWEPLLLELAGRLERAGYHEAGIDEALLASCAPALLCQAKAEETVLGRIPIGVKSLDEPGRSVFIDVLRQWWAAAAGEAFRLDF